MKLSVIIPAFNAARWIARAIDSVLRQQYADWELIVIDDGSTDGTAEMVDRISVTDKRIAVVHKANAGPGVARNTGLDAAHGEYVAFLDSDDELASPDVLDAMMRRLDNTPCDILLARALRMESGGEKGNELAWCLRKDILPSPDHFTPKDAGLSLFFVAGSVPWGKIYRREFLRREKIRFPPLQRSEDFPFVQTAMACARKIAVHDDIMVLHRVGLDDSLESTKDETPLAFMEAETTFFKMLEDRGLWREFAHAAKARAMLRLAYNLASVRSLEGIRAVFACACEARKKFSLADAADYFRDYVMAREEVDGILSHGSAEAWIFARMVAAEKRMREKDAEARNATRENKALLTAKAAMNESLSQSRRDISRLEQNIVALEKKSSELEHSEAYRAGMFVTWPVRKAWGGVKCLRENGFGYSVRHAIGKVLRLFGSKCKW